MITTTNPATGEVLGTYDTLDDDALDRAIEATAAAWPRWSETSFEARAEVLCRAAKALRDDASAHARRMADEMGKPVREGRAEAEKCAWVLEAYAENGEAFLASEQVETDATRSFVAFRPLGVVLAVMPWNFPYWQVFRFAAPALMAGNAGLLKHASNVPGCAQAIEDVFRDAGLPEHVFRSIRIPGERVGRAIEHPRVAAVTLTGSTPAGRSVAGAAGRALKKTVLELGGSDPYVILADADVEHAAAVAAKSRCINSGQSCIAAKRFVVEAPLVARFERLLVERMGALRMGDPRDEATDVGPLARADLRDDLHRQVSESVERGARCLLGGEVPAGPGAYYPPTVLAGVGPGMPAYDEETFGPVAAVIPAEDEADAIRIANDTVFGLGAAVFTSDAARGERIATHALDAGCCFVNDLVRSDPRLPFGGIKESGYGRELSRYGIREFVNVKTVWIR